MPSCFAVTVLGCSSPLQFGSANGIGSCDQGNGCLGIEVAQKLTMVDVLVIGGGNAALCAALTARERGAEVLILESAPHAWRGGNSVHTRNIRCMHDEPQDVLTGSYPEEEFWQDLLKVTGGQTNEELARLVIRESAHCREWMYRHGVRFQASLSGTLHLSRTNAFFMGGGKALMNSYYRSAEKLGVRVNYESPVDRLVIEDGHFVAAEVNGRLIKAKSCVVASGGLSRTANGCARPGDKTNPVIGPPIISPFAARATTWVCC